MWICGWRISTPIVMAPTPVITGMGTNKPHRSRIGRMDMRMTKRARENSMAKRFARAATILALLAAQTIIGTAQQPSNIPADVAPPLRIGSGDLLEVTVFENPD